MISNPISKFITGNDKVDFTYEGGSILYHFSPSANDLSGHMNWNVAFFANSNKHALEVLRRCFQFIIDADEKYDENNKGATNKHAGDYKRRNADEIAMMKLWIKALDEDKITLTIVAGNQFFKIGWAANDTV